MSVYHQCPECLVSGLLEDALSYGGGVRSSAGAFAGPKSCSSIEARRHVGGPVGNLYLTSLWAMLCSRMNLHFRGEPSASAPRRSLALRHCLLYVLDHLRDGRLERAPFGRLSKEGG